MSRGSSAAERLPQQQGDGVQEQRDQFIKDQDAVAGQKHEKATAERKMLSPRQVAIKQEALMEMYQQLEASNEKLHAIIAEQGSAGDITEIKRLTREGLAREAEIGRIKQEIREGAPNPEAVEMRSPAVLQERLNELAKKITASKNEKNKAALLQEVDGIIPVLAKAQEVSPEALRADFESSMELAQEAREDASQKIAEETEKEFRSHLETKKQEKNEAEKIRLQEEERKKEEDAHIAAQAEREYQKKKAWVAGEPARKEKFMERARESRAAKEALVRATDALGTVALADKTKLTEAWKTLSETIERTARAQGVDAAGIQKTALEKVQSIWKERMVSLRGATTQIREERQELREAIARPQSFLERAAELHSKIVASNEDVPSLKQIQETADDRRERAAADVREGSRQIETLVKRGDTKALQALLNALDRDTQSADSEERVIAQQILERYDQDALLKEAARQEVNRQVKERFDAASANYGERRSAEAREEARREGERQRGEREKQQRDAQQVKEFDKKMEEDWKEVGPVVALNRAEEEAEASYYRTQAERPLTREELRAAGIRGNAKELVWHSPQERADAFEEREALLDELDEQKFWNVKRKAQIRERLRTIDATESAFQRDIQSRLPKRTSRGGVKRMMKSHKREERPTGGVFPRE